jgi:hypothetical protein
MKDEGSLDLSGKVMREEGLDVGVGGRRGRGKGEKEGRRATVKGKPRRTQKHGRKDHQQQQNTGICSFPFGCPFLDAVAGIHFASLLPLSFFL